MTERFSPVLHLIETYVDDAGEPLYYLDARWLVPISPIDGRIPTPVAMRDARVDDLGARAQGILALVAALGESKYDDEAVVRCTVWYDFNGARAEHYRPPKYARSGKWRRLPQVLALIVTALVVALLTMQFFAPSEGQADTVVTIRAALIGIAEISALVAAIVAWRRRSNALAWAAIAAAWLSPLVISVPFIIRS